MFQVSVLVDLFVILLLIAGIAQFRSPRFARWGNLTAALALLSALAIVAYRYQILNVGLVGVAILIGSLIGVLAAKRVTMIGIPAMVAFQHGAGGVAAFAISFVELTRHTGTVSLMAEVSALLGLVIGGATFSGSMLAAGKLSAKLRQTPTVWPAHNLILLGLIGAIIGLCVWSGSSGGLALPLILGCALILSMILGVVFSMRIGGADMPVLISFLNATAGLAASFCGVAIQNRLLIACGATVAASGSILTAIMCRAMNRNLISVFTSGAGASKKKTVTAPVKPAAAPQPKVQAPAAPDGLASKLTHAAKILRESSRIIIVPGYGMALAHAQFQVANLAKQLEGQGKDVKFAIHPVAGRMPGHMNVLLAEANVEYDKLREMDEVNSEFSNTDAVIIIGACDVVNPAAIRTEGTPISGMPILNAHEAKNILVCNLDERPGYSGVPNTLYSESKTILLFGDAGKTVDALLKGVSEKASAPQQTESHGGNGHNGRKSFAESMISAKQLLKGAQKVIFVPGYGMALAHAQFHVANLALRLEQMGKTVQFAIHPVAGRMPGHMNVLLAEANVQYDKLREMDDVNSEFRETDAVIIIGACDVVNPAAINTEGTPISGMPILNAHEAKNILVCNLDERPGYSGVANPLYNEPKTLLLFGDASKTVFELLEGIQNPG